MSDTSLNLNTLQNVLTIIDICSKRGALQGSELELVGKTYNEINSFLLGLKKQQEKENAEKENTEKENVENVENVV